MRPASLQRRRFRPAMHASIRPAKVNQENDPVHRARAAEADRCLKEIAYASTLRRATQGAETQPHRARGTAPLRPSGGRPAGRRCQSGTRSRFSPKRLASAPKRTQEGSAHRCFILPGGASRRADATTLTENWRTGLAGIRAVGHPLHSTLGRMLLRAAFERLRVGDDRNRGRWTGGRRGSNRCRCLVLASS